MHTTLREGWRDNCSQSFDDYQMQPNNLEYEEMNYYHMENEVPEVYRSVDLFAD